MLRVNESKLRKGRLYDYESLDAKFAVHKMEYVDGLWWTVGDANEDGSCGDFYAMFRNLWEARRYIFEQGS
jgi:hypothetical protein